MSSDNGRGGPLQESRVWVGKASAVLLGLGAAGFLGYQVLLRGPTGIPVVDLWAQAQFEDGTCEKFLAPRYTPESNIKLLSDNGKLVLRPGTNKAVGWRIHCSESTHEVEAQFRHPGEWPM